MKAKHLIVVTIAVSTACFDGALQQTQLPHQRSNSTDLSQTSGALATKPSTKTIVANAATNSSHASIGASERAADFNESPHDANNNTNHGVEPSLVAPRPITTGDPCNICR